MRRRPIIWLVVLAALVASVGSASALSLSKPTRIKITAHFTEAIGLYKGSSVRVLGVPVGVVTGVIPEGRTVRVIMQVNKDVKVPATALAYIIPPSLVSDRYVQLAPAFHDGAQMPADADIPVERTRTPVELDQILSSLDTVLQALGPNNTDVNGALNDLLTTGAHALKDNGTSINQTIVQLTAAVSTLNDNRDDLSVVVTNLADFTGVLSQSDTLVRRFTKDLGDASTQLAGERDLLAQALKNLAIALDQVNQLVSSNKAIVVDDVNRLKDVSDTLLSDQRSLIEALDTLPLAVQGLGQAAHEPTDATNPSTIPVIDIRNTNQQTSGDVVQNLACLLPQTAAVCSATSGLPPVTVPGVGTASAPASLLGLLKAQSSAAAVLAGTTLQNGATK